MDILYMFDNVPLQTMICTVALKKIKHYFAHYAFFKAQSNVEMFMSRESRDTYMFIRVGGVKPSQVEAF